MAHQKKRIFFVKDWQRQPVARLLDRGRSSDGEEAEGETGGQSLDVDLRDRDLLAPLEARLEAKILYLYSLQRSLICIAVT